MIRKIADQHRNRAVRRRAFAVFCRLMTNQEAPAAIATISTPAIAESLPGNLPHPVHLQPHGRSRDLSSSFPGAKIGLQLFRSLVPIRRILLETLRDDVAQCARDILVDFRQRHSALLRALEQARNHALRTKRHRTGEHLVANQPQREDV